MKTAFLNAPLKETVFVTLPRGARGVLRPDGRPRYFRLLKALYGLKQAPKEWNEELDRTLTELCGLRRLATDSCVYVRTSRTGREMYFTVLVDDIVAAYDAADEAEWLEIKTAIMDKYDVSDGGDCTFLLGMRLTRGADSLTIDQESYIERLLERTSMENAVPVSTPEEPGVRLTPRGGVTCRENDQAVDPVTKTDELTSAKKTEYGSIVGGLLYAAIWTRPDIAHAVGQLTRFISAPKLAHWLAAVRVLRYLRGSAKRGLTFRKERGVTAITIEPVYADANWAGDPDTRRSTTGIVVKVNGCVVAWHSRRQHAVATSSTEAEYMALGDATKEVMWLRRMLDELGCAQTGPTTIFGDNAASLRTAYNDTHHSRMKHIDIRHYFIREQVQLKAIALEWVPTLHQQADILTKGLARNLFNDLRGRVMGEDATEQQ